MAKREDGLPFDLADCEVFLAVCDAGSMAAAARLLGVTQPAVSQTIADLEARTGAVLFDRAVRPIGLTQAGGVLRQRASSLLAEARQIGPLLRAGHHGRLKLLRIGLVNSLARTITVPLAAQVSSIADEASFLSGLTASHAGALLTRNLDIFIGVDDLAEIAGLERWPLLAEPYVLLLPRGIAVPTTRDDLRALATQLPLVRFSERSRTGMEIERHLRRLDLDLPRRLEFDTPDAVAALVESGAGWAVTTPLCVAEAGLPPGAMTVHPLPGPGLRRRLTLIARKAELGPIPRSLAELCRETIEHRALIPLRQIIPWLGDAATTAV